MTTYNTGNPVGSVDVRDLYDNAENLDKFTNGPLYAYPDRFSVSRKSLSGMRGDFSTFLAASGFENPALVYVDSSPLLVSRPTQLIQRAGLVYSVKTSVPFPVTLTGSWAVDELKLVLRIDNGIDKSVISVMKFGAIGNGSADDTAAIQAALDYVGQSSGMNLVFPAGKYKITAPLIFKPSSVPAALAGSDIHFSEHVESIIYASGDARIIAGSAMTHMLMLQFNSATSSIGPFYTTIQGLTFDGANIASEAIRSDYTMHLNIIGNKIWRVTTGIYYLGYGVARIRSNVIKCPICINFAEGGGDSVVSENDFYPLTGGRGVSYGKLSGNSVVTNNVFSGEGNTGCYGVYLDGNANLVSDGIRNVRVVSNEFSGMVAAVYGQRHASGRNVYGVIVTANHTTPAAGGAVHAGALVLFNGIDDAKIYGNYINGVAQSATLTTEPGVQLQDCRRPLVFSNSFGNLKGPAIYAANTLNGKIHDNQIDDCAQLGASSAVIDIDTGCQGLKITSNTIAQSSAGFGQTPIIERAGANSNEFRLNDFSGMVNRVSKSGAASVVSGRVVASGSFSASGGGAVLRPNSSGFTVSRSAVGVVTVTLSTPRNSNDYIVKVSTDTFMYAVDSYTQNSFIVRTLNQAGAAIDPAVVIVEVVD